MNAHCVEVKVASMKEVREASRYVGPSPIGSRLILSALTIQLVSTLELL